MNLLTFYLWAEFCCSCLINSPMLQRGSQFSTSNNKPQHRKRRSCLLKVISSMSSTKKGVNCFLSNPRNLTFSFLVTVSEDSKMIVELSKNTANLTNENRLKTRKVVQPCKMCLQENYEVFKKIKRGTLQARKRLFSNWKHLKKLVRVLETLPKGNIRVFFMFLIWNCITGDAQRYYYFPSIFHMEKENIWIKPK